MRYSMENASMKVEVESLGAELKSVLGKKSNIEQQSGVLQTECTKSVSDCWKPKRRSLSLSGKDL